MKKLITLCLLNLVSLSLCTSASDQNDARKTAVRSASTGLGASSHLNSLTSSQDSIGKQQQQQLRDQQDHQHQHSQQQQQQQQLLSPQQTYTRIAADYSSLSQPHSTIYTQLQTGQPTAPSGGYYISVNPQGTQTPTAINAAGPTPVIMQYLPHNSQTGPIQYLQLIPTRPLIVPISPYISSFNNPYNPSGNAPQAQASTQQPYSVPHHHHSYTPTSSHSYGNNYQPTLQSPIGGYSTNYLTYFRPNGMQLVNGPMDLSLNTNEYLPLQNENNSYKVRRA